MATKKRDSSKEPSTKSIYNKLLDFLNTPIWALPVMSFIEQRSIVFDREQGDPKLYMEIHKEFCGMVDMLIECFCDDMGIEPDQLVASLRVTDQSKKMSQKEKKLLEPVVAAQDFEVFVPMMARKNIELQLQALQMIEFMCGLVPAVLQINSEEVKVDGKKVTKKGLDPDEHERIILIQVMNQSKEEFDREAASRNEALKQIEAAVRDSLVDKERLEAARDQEQLNIQDAMKQKTDGEDANGSAGKADDVPKRKGSAKRPTTAKSRPATSKERPITAKKEDRGKPTELSAVKGPKVGKTAADIRAMLKDAPKVSDESMEARASYLREQRDKLLAMKKVAREKAFEDSEKDARQARPKTAKAAKGAMRGQAAAAAVGDDVLAARRALAQKLKNEVMT
uniref:Cilia- and flagella-associated protein 36 n=1 Tax=Plectus sambesii TaxID=2011161 RepID=A0A914WBX2_9BILA